MNHFDNIEDDEIQLMEEEEEDEESDVEDEDGTDSIKEAEPKVTDEQTDDTFSKRLIESVVNYFSFLRTRTGRAGMVHNFLRGLKLTTAPVPSGENIQILEM